MKFNAQITKRVHEILCKYICIREISLNTNRNTLDFMCDLELFSKIRSHISAISKYKSKKILTIK